MIPKKEFIKINMDAAVIMYFGLATRIKNSIGLKKIPPPIPTTPEINPKTPPIKIAIGMDIFLYLSFVTKF